MVEDGTLVPSVNNIPSFKWPLWLDQPRLILIPGANEAYERYYQIPEPQDWRLPPLLLSNSNFTWFQTVLPWWHTTRKDMTQTTHFFLENWLHKQTSFWHLLGLKSITIHSIMHEQNTAKPQLISQKHVSLLVLAITE